ncbi:MAG: ATP-binding protein [Candidatus Omnitrophica bacterium]|nr:ATP-binding protein [Candidatus Omnitrophota bacterium]
MPKTNFIDKFLDRFDRLDRLTIRNTFMKLEEEHNLAQLVLSNLPDGVVVFDTGCRFVFANRIARLILGIGADETVRNKSIDGLVQDPDLGLLLKEYLGEHKQLLSEEVKMLEPRERAVSLGIMPLHDNEGTWRGNVVVLSDLSAKRERERQRSRSEHIETLTSLASGIAHEIGNPLNSIGIHLDLIKREIKTFPKAQREALSAYLEVVERETKRLNKMVKNFLQATRPALPAFEESDINHILANSIRLLKPELKEKNIALGLKLNRRIPPFLIDAEKMHRAFVNVIRNAIQSMPKGGTVVIETKQKEKLCLVSFKDEGYGIPEGDIPRIFEAYYTTKEEGSGLGLLITYNIVKEHGGRIDVKSSVGKGTEITIVLPIRREKLQLPYKKKREPA